MIDLRALRSFLILSEELHFGRAARRLNIVQPALSMQIKALEAEVGAPLFLRTSRQVALSPMGDLLRVEAGRLLAQADRSLAVVSRAAAGSTGRVVVGFAGTAALVEALSSTLAAFRTERPDVELDVREMGTEAQMRALAEGLIDVGYCPSLPSSMPDDLDGVVLESLSWHVAVSTASVLSRKRRIGGEDLRGLPMISYESGKDGEGQRRVLRQIIGEAPLVAHRAENTLSVLAMAAAGLGVAVVPSPLAAVALPGLAFRPIAGDHSIDLRLLWRRSEVSPAVTAYVDRARRWRGRPGRGLPVADPLDRV